MENGPGPGNDAGSDSGRVSAAVRPSLAELAGLFLRVTSTTFGSGGATVIFLGRELRSRRWLEDWKVELYMTIARVLPGTNVMAFVASTSHAISGWPGAVACLLAASVPASLAIIALALGWERWNGTTVGGAFINGAMSSIVGIITGSAWLLAASKFEGRKRLRTVLFVAGGAVLSRYMQPLAVMGLAAVAGFFWAAGDESR